MRELVFREMTVADLSTVAELEQSVHVTPWSLAQMSGLADFLGGQYRGFVAQMDELAGYVVLQVLVDEVEILTIGVAQHMQGQGIGTVLIDGALSELQSQLPSLQACFLEVRESNAAAQALYRKLKFTQVGKRQNYYQNPREHALIYRLDLTR
jgi:ribosomal-protein-alanine N-acetyltransferase